MTGRYYDERRPEQIEDDIERTRADLDETLDEIERRLSPSQLADRAMRYVSSGPGEFGTNLGRQIRENPIPIALIGIGLAWLMIAGQRERRPRYRYAAAAPERFRGPRSRLWDEGYEDPYRAYGDERVGGPYEPYEDYGRYEDYEPYEAYDDEDVGAVRSPADVDERARRTGGAYGQPAPDAYADPLSSDEGRRPSTTGATDYRTTEERL